MIVFAISVLLLFETVSSQFNITKIKYNQEINGTTNGDLIPLLYEMIPNNDTRPFGALVFFSNVETPIDYPITLTAMRGSSVLTTSIPRTQTYEGISTRFAGMGEMLCEERNLRDETFTTTEETIRISVSSSVPAQFKLAVITEFDYVARVGQPLRQFVLTPVPLFVRFSFPRGLDTVAIRVRSDDDDCGRVTIQKANCPVFDTEGQVILYSKYEHQTITRKGYIIVSRADFGDNIHIITSVLPVQDLCRSKNGPIVVVNETGWKRFELKVIPFQPNKTSIYMLLELFVVLLGVATGLAIWLYDENNENDEDSILNGTEHFWTYTLSQIYTVIPLAVVLVSLRDSESLLSSYMDMCNFNYECAIPWGPFKAANNMLSASSITVVAFINFWVSWCVRRVRRLFPLNAWIFMTGFLWTLMNICPQKHTFYLYTLAMLMTIVEAKLLLFGKRNGRNIKHYRIIGCLTMMLMTLHALEKIIQPNFWRYIWYAGILWVEALYVFYFSYAHGVTEDEVKNIEIVELHQSSSNQLEPVNNEYSPVTQNTPAVVIPAIESEQDLVVLNPAGSSSQNVVEVEVEPVRNADIERNDSRENLVPADESENSEVRRNLTKHFKKAYLISGLINILFWAIFFFWYDSSVIILRVIQTDFAIYFLLYYFNKVSYEKVFKTSFYWLTALFVLFIIAWGVISAYFLPAFVPWSAAESRTLNKTCFSVNGYCLGMDWHDILHFVTAAICFLYPLIVSKIDQAFKVNEPSRTF
ncbi:hypothetical protein B9Z55_022718 [Caenorhabditis nigoni]|uniref:Uncharacterized protein n=1 Tax=Caenorhabditis nigoni TaxID=1611254 RepID=A0A2G5SLY0_9PELO|nr:hypothetical protein B9Z55_022718 [Caenorhabditis nigoni]